MLNRRACVKDERAVAATNFTGHVISSFGGAVRLGPLKAGLNYKSADGGATGLRGGQAGEHHSADFTIFFFGADYFDDAPIRFDDWRPTPAAAQDAGDESDEDEDFEIENREAEGDESTDEQTPAIKADEFPKQLQQSEDFEQPLRRLRGKLFRALAPLGTQKPAHKSRNLLKDDDTDWAPAYYFTQLEIQLGVYLGLRLGWNAGETFDWLAGWFGFDPLDDDEPYADDLEEQLEKLPYWQLLSDDQKEEIRERLREGGGLPASPF